MILSTTYIIYWNLYVIGKCNVMGTAYACLVTEKGDGRRTSWALAELSNAEMCPTCMRFQISKVSATHVPHLQHVPLPL